MDAVNTLESIARRQRPRRIEHWSRTFKYVAWPSNLTINSDPRHSLTIRSFVD
jgi:hypothetical protein